ncbi:hypothetical protein Poli38472_001043 [Pythium oligandrum]|uniref:Uncharacterized protein n=1 Tax=Pythium oligandrum TaxID=41045 RepID=A0A8K1CS68_PYTOL|nr:hypothetical protein Poli38472_001043 [Pythium oligandrum]|eukprot:TMW68887.1 hypothetical protein Poli38472_001043 [Pythium oligandrum]
MRVRARELPKDRVLVVVALSCSLLLLSGVMLHSHEDASTSARTFRDGFIVANAQRRTESTSSAPPSIGGGLRGASTQLEVENGTHLTKIKTEDGDEITIKRGANSNKITKISAHEDGMITIENREHTPDDNHEGDMKDRHDDSEDTVRGASDTEPLSTGYEKLSADREIAGDRRIEPRPEENDTEQIVVETGVKKK